VNRSREFTFCPVQPLDGKIHGSSMLAWWKFIYGGFVLNVTVSVLLYHRVFDLIFSVGMTNNNKKRHVDESWERQKKQALLLYLSVNNSYYRDRLKKTIGYALSIF